MTVGTPVRAQALSPPRQLSRQRLMLLAEDDDEVRDVLISIFEADGFEVSSARDGRELLRRLYEARDRGRLPDIVITDYRMPELTGLEVAQMMREDDWPVPIIVMTAFGRELEGREQPGVDLVFHKPFDADDLRTAVLYCLKNRWKKPRDLDI